MRPTATVLALLLAAPLAAAPPKLHENPRNLQPMDVFALEWAQAPAVSPDGRWIAYERTGFDRLKDRRRSELWLLSADGGSHRPLTSGPSARQPTWSPDGTRLAYVQDAGSNRAQIHVRWMDSGQRAVLTQLEENPADLAFSPDGRWIAFTMRVPAEEGDELAELPKKPDGADWAPRPRLIDRLVYRRDGAGYVEPGYRHVFVVPAEGGAPRQLTDGGYDHTGPVVWLPDGRALVVTANRNPDWEYDPLDSELYRIELAGGAATALTDRDGPDAAPALSPDGRSLAYLGFDDRRLAYQLARLYVLDLGNGSSRELTATLDRNVSAPVWDARGRGIHFAYTDQGLDKLGWVDAGGGAVRTLAQDFGGTAMGRPYGGGDFHAAGGTVAYTRGTVERPAEIAVIRGRAAPRVLTELNRDALDHKRLGAVEERWVESSVDGLRIHAWVVKPPGFEAGRKYPLLLEIHGGPHADYGPRFAPETQLYASAGYVVVYANPRGSSSYGEAFANLIRHDYPNKDFHDLMSVVDAVIAEGYVDTGNLFVTGGSGGGVLTAWIVGHTDRFRAAVVAKPVINWISFALTADVYPFFTGYWFPALPWEDPTHYLERSPLMYVGQVKTPTMLLTGEDDHRTPISETEQFYQALKLRRVDTAMVRIPGASHGINQRPSHMLAQVLYTLGWFERYRQRD
ncbi:MAG TPA: S9 family peptidase [Xanthomonadaceae bacterium]|nr:S9 family peptidase [Xanthomonadaceae bacterium]